ncbi:MAG: hypothetical protein MUF83_07355 [Acidimicrobiales bacterium]|nr:hypothetical protein [Acidimicrobiales bacterium]
MDLHAGIDLSGTWRAAPADEELRRTYAEPDFDDAPWEHVAVPSHWRSNPAFADQDGPLLYRTRFETATARDGPDAPGSRTWLVVDGIFYTSDVWLDGAYVGDTEGWFFPHTFEITDHVAARTDHLLAFEVTCAPQTDRRAKRNLTGVFQHGLLIDPDWNPGGIWRPVRLERSGPVRIRHSRALCLRATEARAEVFVRCVLDAVEPTSVELVTRVAGVEHVETRPLAAGENRMEWTVTVPDPVRWWPHALGEPVLHDLTVEVRTGDGVVSDRRHRRIGLRQVELRNWILSVNGERLFLKGACHGPTRQALAEATDDEVARDVRLARDAGLDFLRVHTHVARPALYDAADEAGLLLWQDMPLQWGYHRSVRSQARRQARELVDLLGHHPSVFLWCGHNEPMALDVQPDTLADPTRRRRLGRRAAAAQALPSWNRSVLDHSISSALERSDPSRPVVPHSGVLPHPPQLDGTDSHLWFGWHHGSERDLEPLLRRWPRLARFVGEFGAQAVPGEATFLEPQRWPDLDWDRAARHHALRKGGFDDHVPPDAHPSFDAWRDATQRYQAALIRHHVETLRRLKYRPCGGFALFCLADAAPAVSWSVLDHTRAPKLGYAALAAACAAVIVATDRPPAEVRPGEALALDVHVVNDRREPVEGLTARAELRFASGPGAARRGLPPDGDTWTWSGSVPADAVVRVGTLQFVVPAFTTPHDTDVLQLSVTLTGDGVHTTTSQSARVVPG